MTRLERNGNPLLWVVISLSAAGVFFADVVTPLGVAVWVFYLVPLVLSLYTWRMNSPILVAMACTALIVVGYFISLTNVLLPPSVARINRGFGVLTIWGVALIARQFIETKLRLAERDWIRQGQTSLVTSMQGEQSGGELGNNILKCLCEYMEVPVGLFIFAMIKTLRSSASRVMLCPRMQRVRRWPRRNSSRKPMTWRGSANTSRSFWPT